MIRSMTGYGRSEKIGEQLRAKVEIKSVNHRYSDVTVKMPRHLSFMEEVVKGEVKKNLTRGKVEVYISVEYINATVNVIKVDYVLAENYKKSLEELCDRLCMDEEIKLGNIIGLPEIVRVEKEGLDEDETASFIIDVLSLAVNEILKMKINEGLHLQQNILECLSEIEGHLKNVTSVSKELPDVYKRKLKNRIDQLLSDEKISIDPERLALEVALLADKSDINEEIIRLESHIRQFHSILKKEDYVGRKLDFLVQEMNREMNTIGSKSNEINILNDVVEMKSQLEKIREQIQNVE